MLLRSMGLLTVAEMKTFKMSNYAASRGATKHVDGGSSCGLTQDWNDFLDNNGYPKIAVDYPEIGATQLVGGGPAVRLRGWASNSR